NKDRVAVCGYCMGGRIAIHFVAATPEVRAFVGYYPTVRDEPTTPLRPVHPSEAAKTIRCPSIILYGADDVTTVVPVQDMMWDAFKANGQRLECTSFHSAATATSIRARQATMRTLASCHGRWW